MALFHFSAKVLSRSGRNTVRAMAYRSGCKLYDEKTGETFNYGHKSVEHVELLLLKDAPEWAVESQKLMEENRRQGVQAFVDKVEGAEKRVDAQVWREFEFALHRELTKEQNMALAREFIQDQICSHGMAAQLNFHFDVDKETGEEKPHCHVVMTTRCLGENGLSEKKEREWNKKELLCELRQQWQDYSNFHLKLHGHDVQIDHRSHKDRGIDMEPQPKLSKGVRELEQRLQKLEGDEHHTPITDKAKAFHEVQLRNLYRIMRHPEVVFEIVTKHHATFMWADVQKVLHRYVDDVPLFQRLDAKLKSSNELMLLKADPDGRDIYTTRTMLKTEKSLVETAETLNTSKSHTVKEYQIHHGIRKADEDLKTYGGLSHDQKRAIYHMVDEGQLRCVVGIAGAGKTTALGVCQDIWQAEGYAVYGLAPTGKAAQNLEQSGISSMTLHKFLKSFEDGRCQYNPNSVLVLDEAGMVDMERFEKLLGVVKQLGVKLITVGDGAQLQPVEAGPAFRLVTTCLGKAELNTVIRQKEEWQKEATILFGRQETQAAIQKYVDKGHVHIVEEGQPTQGMDKRQNTKEALVQAWHIEFTENPGKQSLILAHSNRDVNDLNTSARILLKESGHISKEDFTYTIAKMTDDDFGRKRVVSEEKNFSKGDRIVFTRNNNGLGVKNGTMGTITDLNRTTVQIKLNDGSKISFAPNLNPYFDQGWAITIHKSQGTTVDQTFVLASYQMTQNLAYVAMTRHREDVQVFGSFLDFWKPEKLPEILSKSGEKLSAGDYLDADSLNKLMQKEDHLLTKIFERISNELEAMGAVSKKVFWQVADHFFGVNRDKEIRVNQDFSKGSVREEVRAETLLRQKDKEIQVEPAQVQAQIQTKDLRQLCPSQERTPTQDSGHQHSHFATLVKHCEQRLYHLLEKQNMPVTSQRKERIVLQAERTATYILHTYGERMTLPPEAEMVNFSLRAKYELDRLPEIQQDLMEQGEKSSYRAYQIANRLASIEGRLTSEARAKGMEALYPSYDAKKELARHREELPHLSQELMRRYDLSDTASQRCAQNILRYKETHGEKPSTEQMAKMVEISQRLEHKDYERLSSDRDIATRAFLRQKEADLLFKHGLSHDASSQLDQSQMQAKKSLELFQKQMENERVHSKQMEMGL